jgi:Flp pilus assembly CpaE family ATPase
VNSHSERSHRARSAHSFGQWLRGETTTGSTRTVEESAKTTTKKRKEENETHVEQGELCRCEHTRWHGDEAVVVELNETRRECVRFDTRNASIDRRTKSCCSLVARSRPAMRARLRSFNISLHSFTETRSCSTMPFSFATSMRKSSAMKSSQCFNRWAVVFVQNVLGGHESASRR